MIYDVITYNGEDELFEIRYNILKDYVDEFRVIEFDETFSGDMKSCRWNVHAKYPKVRYYWVTKDVWSKYKDLALSSPNTEYGKGAEHWVREFCMKESIKDCLTDLKHDDKAFIGDVDEIWQPQALDLEYNKLKLRVYSYHLNNLSNEQFWGPIVINYQYRITCNNSCLNHLRTEIPKTTQDFGWHFTSMGGADKVYHKLTDSYTFETYATDHVLDNLEANITNNKDFLGRDFTYELDETNWPQYLKDNKDKYKHLLRP